MNSLPHLNGRAALAWAALEGLAQPQKRIPCTWLYDQRGSELFEQITDLPEYYPTRTEIDLLRRHAREMAAAVGCAAVVIEIGSGSSRKTPLLLRELQAPRAYVPIDIAPHCLEASVASLKAQFTDLPMYPLVADFNQPLRLPAELPTPAGRHLCFFPGSTIGNLDPAEALAFLRRMADTLGPEARMLVGVDTTRDPAALIPAYDDPSGVTAAFNLNLLARLNRELESDFDLAAFRHEARYDHHRGRIEMHLVSRRPQEVHLLGKTFRFAAGESIHTENSHKYPVDQFQTLAQAAGWQPAGCWTDGEEHFSIHLLGRRRS
ncbi:MAG: hypothetical protein H6R10_3389 [Rhodocyclaceae bacterium]|nr:hypothetical protein [Rhodocyclaceae bacterium]